MKKKLGLGLLSLVAFVFCISSPKALSTYNYESWTSGAGYGQATKIDDVTTNLKGESNATGGMYIGPYSKASTAKLADGITEEVYVEIDPSKIDNGEYFEVSLALKNSSNEYVSEAVVMTQKTGNDFVISSGWAPGFSAKISNKGIYTYQWKMYVEGDKTYVEFTLLMGKRVISTTGKIDFDTIVTPDTKNPIASQDDVSVKYLWFCNISIKKGINVYTELPTVNVTLVDPTEEEDLVLEAYKYCSFTKEELDEIIQILKEAAKEEGYNFEGFYSDEKFENEYNMLNPFTEDVTIYVKASKIEEPVKDVTPVTTTQKAEKNPNTADNVGLYFVLAAMGLGVVGLTTRSLIKHH
ncbi:MAG: hypothetical protein U0M66_00055 [Bacilli bacterium]|nr:hypothetical protein [Bacilli bacterium]